MNFLTKLLSRFSDKVLKRSLEQELKIKFSLLAEVGKLCKDIKIQEQQIKAICQKSFEEGKTEPYNTYTWRVFIEKKTGNRILATQIRITTFNIIKRSLGAVSSRTGSMVIGGSGHIFGFGDWIIADDDGNYTRCSPESFPYAYLKPGRNE